MVATAWEAESDDRNRHIAELSGALSGQGHDVTLYRRRTSPSGQGTTEVDGYRVVRVPAGPHAPLSKADLLGHLDEFGAFLEDEWRDRRPDVVHLHSWTSGLAVADGRGVPLVQSFHGLGVVEQRFRKTAAPGRATIERLVGAAAYRVLAGSAEEVFDLIRMGVHRSRVSLVPRGVDTRLFQPDGPAMRGGARHRLLALGDVAPHSGFETAISVLPRLPGAELVIAGPIRHTDPRRDPEVERLVLHARGLGVADRVTFTGRVDHVRKPALLRSADVVVCPSWYEPSGSAALEAMACGVPVVASAVGAFKDVVVDDVTGVLVPPRDPRALLVVLRGLLADGTRREMYSIAGADRVHARYDWDRVAAEVVDAYDRAPAVRSPARGTSARGR
ncbi:MAG TPA: glycosyltransferase [Umezawaea sp.]